MFEEDLKAWRQVSVCQSLLENLLRDIARLEETIVKLLGESDDTSDSSRDTVYASDDAVREIVASIVDFVEQLDAELDMKQELLSSDCAQEAMATWGSDWRANEHSPSGIWFFDAPSLRQRIRRLVIQVQPDEPLTSVSFGSYIDYFQMKQKQAIRSLNELEATAAVKDLRYREALGKHRQNPAPAKAAADDDELPTKSRDCSLPAVPAVVHEPVATFPDNPLPAVPAVAHEPVATSPDNSLSVTPAARCELLAKTLIPTHLQDLILRALNGEAMKKEDLMRACKLKDGSQFYREGGLNELREAGLVAHKNGVGYYRPDAPPPNAIQLGPSLNSPQGAPK